MRVETLMNLIEKPISGEWGNEGKGIKVIRSTNFTNEGILNLDNVIERDIPEKKIESKLLKKGDIIIEKSGGSPNQPVGRVVFFDRDDRYLFSNFTSVLRPKSKEVYPKYLHYILFATHRIGVTNLFQNKTTGILNLQLNRYIQKLKIPLPPLPIQQKIAQVLDRADALRQRHRQIIHHYDQLAQSVFLEMFGDPVKNPKGWEVKPTIELTSSIVPGRDKPKSFTGYVPWVTTDDLCYLGFTFRSKKNIGLTESEIQDVNAKLIPANSVIMTCVGDLGVVSINKKEIIINQQLHAFQCKSKLIPIFLMYNLSFQLPYFLKMASNTTVPYLNKTKCNNTPCIVPPLSLPKPIRSNHPAHRSSKTTAATRPGQKRRTVSELATAGF